MEYFAILSKVIHVLFVNDAGKALFVCFRRWKDYEHLTILVSRTYQQQEPRTNTVKLQADW